MQEELNPSQHYKNEEFKSLTYGPVINSNEKVIALFNKLYNMNEYKQDCYNTNKYLHLIKILKDRGFSVNVIGKEIVKTSNKEIKEMVYEEKLEKFDIDLPQYEKINKYQTSF